MALSTANRAKVRLIQESAFGVIPNTGNPNDVRFTGESLAYAIQTATSNQIRSDRQVSDLVLVGASGSGGINFELSYREFDKLFQAAFQGTFVEYGTLGVGTALSLTLNSAAGTITAGAAPTGADAFTNIAVGQFFKLNAPADPANGQFLKLLSKTTTVITVDTATPLKGTGTRAVAGSSISTARLVNGTTERSFTIERALEDVGQYFAYRGMSLSKMSLSFASGAIATGSFDFLGKDAVRQATTQLPGVSVASQVFDVMNAVNGVGNVLENGIPLTGTFIKTLKIDIDNKLRARDAISVLGAASIGSGTLAVTGTMEIYLADGTLYDKFINNTATSIAWTMQDTAGNGYAIQFPKVKYSDAKVQAGGLDQDVILSLPFTAILDPVTGSTLIIDRMGA